MKTKSKLMICVLIFMLGGVLNVFLSTALHNILSGEARTLEFAGFFEGIGSMTASRQHLLLFSCAQGFISILAFVFYISDMRSYQSHLNAVTPEIQTPAAVGQFQHGSAKWLSDKEKDKAFDSFILDPHDERINGLIQSGYDGIDFMKPNRPT